MATVLPKFNKNEEREKEKGGERKQRNFGNTVTEIPLLKMLSGQLKKSNCSNAIAEKGKKKNCFGNCGNAIADNVKYIYIYIYFFFFFDNCGNPIAENGKKKIMKYVNE